MGISECWQAGKTMAARGSSGWPPFSISMTTEVDLNGEGQTVR